MKGTLSSVSKLFCSLFLVIPVFSCAQEKESESQNQELSASIIWKKNKCEEIDKPGNSAEGGITSILFAALAPKLVDLGLNLLSDKVQEKTESFTVSYVGVSADTWGRAYPAGAGQTNYVFDKGCVIFYSGDGGEWGEEARRSDRDSVVKSEKAFYPESLSKKSKRPAILLMADLDYLTVGMRGIVFKVAPYKFAFNKSGSRGKPQKELLATFKFSVPSIITGDQYVSEIPIQPIKDIRAPMRVIFEDSSSGWVIAPKVNFSDKEAEASGTFMPIATNLQITIIETDTGKGSEVYRAINDAFEESKSELRNYSLEKLGLSDEAQKQGQGEGQE